ncbi:MAG TPA: alpha/beta fold hydrolase [Thermoanaerobaculia bacterium]|jgi:dienelactone hydrolase|nr:alpha/beta fold hydrolase [Thermoanaerobaculia bacterium]
MKRVLLPAIALFLAGVATVNGEPAPARPVALKASDGTKLAASYYSSGDAAGPGVLLLHQCNMDRSSWNGLASDLASRGFHVLTLDYRGYGDSGGKPYTQWTAADQQEIGGKWPGDVDTAFAYLRAQPGVRGDALGAGGASCGVNQSIQLARRHPEVKSLVLLSGFTDRDGRAYLHGAKTLPLLLAASDDDDGAVQGMAWLDAASGNPKNQFVRFTSGGHGTVMFRAHPELPRDIVAWYEATLAGKGSAALASATPRPDTPAIRLLVTMDEPGGPARVAESLKAERARNPTSPLLETGLVNQVGYAAVEAGDPRSAIAILQLNVDARPASANAWDSLGDALLAAGEKEKARTAAEKALALVDADPNEDADRRQNIRDSARQKLDRLKAAPK